MGSSNTSTILSTVAHDLSRIGVKSTSNVLVAVSGGVDSMSLAHILNELRKQGHFKKLGIVHINHSLRGKESDKDEILVRKYAKKLKIPIQVFSVVTKAYSVEKKIGIEEAARILRYEKMISLCSSKKYNFAATAHTANDQAETVLMNIIRGSGLNGLQGIPELRTLSDQSLLIRPILGITKKDLRSFAKENGIPFREDASNDSLDFQRNRVRHLVLPALEKAFKDRDIYSGFAKMTRNVASVAEYLETEVQELLNKTIVERPSFFIQRKIISLKREELIKAPSFLRRELILQEASLLSCKLVSIDQIHSLLMDSYLCYPSNKPFYLTKEIILHHDGKFIVIELVEEPPVGSHSLSLNKKIHTPIGFIASKKIRGWEKSNDTNTACFQYEELQGRKLMIRYWNHGDKMKPFGMKGKSRLVSDILSEAGIKSERLKYFVPLIVFQDEPDFILWIPGIRSAEFGRLRNKSETAIELKRSI